MNARDEIMSELPELFEKVIKLYEKKPEQVLGAALLGGVFLGLLGPWFLLKNAPKLTGLGTLGFMGFKAVKKISKNPALKAEHEYHH